MERHRQKLLGVLMLAPASNSSSVKEKKKEEEDEGKLSRNWSGDDFPWTTKLKGLMHNIFGATSFRYFREKIWEQRGEIEGIGEERRKEVNR